MRISPLAGKPAPKELLVNLNRGRVAASGCHRHARGRANHRETDIRPGNGAPIGGLKVVTDNGWFAARPSGTENIYKIYAESFKDQNHLAAIVEEAQEIVTDALGSPAPALREQEVHG